MGSQYLTAAIIHCLEGHRTRLCPQQWCQTRTTLGRKKNTWPNSSGTFPICARDLSGEDKSRNFDSWNVISERSQYLQGMQVAAKQRKPRRETPGSSDWSRLQGDEMADTEFYRETIKRMKGLISRVLCLLLGQPSPPRTLR